MRLFLIIMLAALLSAGSARAAEDCAGALRGDLAGIVTIVRSMADYKAAMDAGYAACMVRYPKDFAPLREANNLIQTNMQRELGRARAVLDRLIDRPESESTAKSCAADEKGRSTFKNDAHGLIEGQYSKAYARRHREMAQTDLVSRDQDSCMIVLDMVKKYRKYYGDYDRLRYVLYEAMKKQQKESGAAGRHDFRLFENTRDRLFAD